MMKHSIACLHDGGIGRLLTGEVDAARTSELEQHLADCIDCRQRLEQQVGDDGWWNETESSLRSQHVAASLRDAEDVDPDAASLRETRLRGTRLRESVLDLLGPTDDPNMLGRIGSYEIIGLLGQGGMGAVFKGFDRSLNRFVAIKMLLPHLAASGAARKRFAREGQAVAAVVDDHVMAIHCVDEWQGVPYLVMTYSRGVSLQKRLSDDGPLEVREILRIGMQAAKGLAAAHAQGIVHRDIKPANIFLDQNVERVQLMDFGLARAVDDASLTRSGTLAGTPQYMSPEQARAEAVDHRSDLFSLGSVMYAMCTGHAPFRAESSYSVLRLITDKEPRPIREVNPDVPDWLCTIINKLMAKQADDRFSSAQEVAQILEDCLAHVQQPTVNELPRSLTQHLVPMSGSSRPARLMQQFNRSGIRAWLLAGVGVMAFMLIAMMLQDNGPERSGQGESGPVTGAHANLNELLQRQKAREESIRQISYKGTVRQYAKQDIQRTNTESVDEFVARCVGLAPVYDEFSPYPLSASRDFSSGVYRFTVGDINAGIPNDIKYMDWFIDKKKYVQLMGRDPGTCDAVVTNNREDIRDDREASLVRLDIAAFQPVKDILMSEVLTKAISEPGIPDVGGRPLWKLEPLDSKVGWKATFMFQQPVANPPGAKQILWHRVYWEQIGGELVIVRVEKLTVDGDEKSTPQSVVMIDDYRSVCGRPVPFRIRFFNFGNVFVQGAELIVSDLKINDYVDVPDGVPIPEGTRVRNLITGENSRQPASKNTDPITDAELIQGTWNVLDLQQVGYEASEDERNIYKNGGYKITFTKNKMIHSPDHSSMQYRVDTTETPHVLELLQSGKVIAKAIYELAGDDLKICQGRTPTDGSDPEPPTSFDIKQAPTKFPSLYILRRTKPIEPIAIPMGVGASDAATGTRASGPSGKQNPKRLQIREATVVEAGTDSSQQSVESKVVEFSGMRLRLNPAQPAILSEDDIMTVESVTDPNNPKASQIVLTLTPEAGERFLIETTRLSSQPNPGYLIIEFEGTILSAPRVNSKISRKVTIAASKEDDIEKLVAAIRESIATQPTPVQHIQRVLTSNRTEVQKAQFLRQLFSVGESYAEVLKRLQVSEPGGIKGGPLQTDIAFDSCDLVLSFDAQRRLFRIGYYVHSPTSQSPEYHELVPDLWVKVKADRQIVNEVVRAFMKDAGDVETTKTLTRDLPQAVTAKLFSLAAENALNELPMEFDYVNDSAEPTKAIATLIALTFEPQSIGLTKEVFVVFRLTMADDGWVIDDIDFESKEDADRELKSFLNANPKSVPSITQMKLDRSNARSVVEAYVAAARAGDRKKVLSLTGVNPQEPEQLAKTIDSLLLNLTKLDSLATKTVYVNSPDCPSKGIALTKTLKWEHLTNPSADRIDVRLRFELSKSDQRWSVTEIGIEAEELADESLKKFLEANPTAISILPQGSTERAAGGDAKFLVLDCEEIDDLRRILGLTQLEEIYINQFVYPNTDFKILKELPQLRKLTFSKWSGLSSDEVAKITASLPGVEVVEEENQLDRKNARVVVEAYIALALSGDIAKAAALAKNGHATADPKRIAEIPDFLNVQRLKIQTVYVNDPANPKRALATSAAVKLEEEHKQPNGQRDGFMVLTLELTDDKWFVIDIDFESESGAAKELKRFLEANPNSIGLPPLTSGEVVVQNANVSAPPAGDAAKAVPAESPLLVEARKALQTCQNSLSWKQKFDMRVTNSYVHSQVGKVTIESRVRRDAPRMVESSLQTFDDQPKDHIRLDNWRLDDGEMFIGRTTTVGQKKLTGLMTIKGRQKASWRMFESSSSFAMEGHFPGNQGRTLMEILMESKEPDVRMEKIGDHDCLRISDHNDWGTMTVWIDAGPSRRLRQWESSKERGNRFADGRVGEDKDTANLESFSYFVEDIQYQVLDGIEIAVSCRLRSTSIPNGGTKQETSTEYKRTEIHLRPDFAINNPFVGDFDNGARINDGDAFDRDAAFRWQDGKLTVLSGQASGSGLDP